MTPSASDQSKLGLVAATQSLLDRFGNNMTGARQATRLQMVHFLARKFRLIERQADELFKHLRAIGIVNWQTKQGDCDADDAQHREGWHISIEPISRLDQTEFQWIEPEEAEVSSPEDVTPAIDLIKRAVNCRATDIHLDPYGDEFEVRFRIDGRLEHYCRLSQRVATTLITQLKVMSELDIADPFHPLEGRLHLPLPLSENEVRITTTPVTGGEATALRILHHEQLLRPLGELGFSTVALNQVQELLRHGEGIVLVTGPTGAGKTTTVYSMVHALDDGHRNIVTIEDPVEYKIPSFLQVEVDRQHGVTMANGLRTLLRMDPDIVMLGEIRESEAADAAMRAASSGKYVFSTFHTRDMASTVTALRDLHVDSRSLAGNLRGIISQRLVRRLCRNCCGLQAIDDWQVKIFEAHEINPPAELGVPVGCSHCRQTGFFERIGVFEVETNRPTIATAVEHGAAEDEIRDLLRSEYAGTLSTDALLKVCDGITSLEEALAMTWVEFGTGPAD
jgi:general secretion pathway protein E